MTSIYDCKKIQPLLAAFADGELTAAANDGVRAHLTGCAVCQSIADDFAVTARLVATLPTPKGPSANFEALLARRIADESLAPKPLSAGDKLRGWWEETSERLAPTGWRLAPAFAATVAALIVLVPTGYFLTGRNAETPVAIASPTVDAASVVASDPAVIELLNEHTAFSAAQTLGDPAQSVVDGFVSGSEEN